MIAEYINIMGKIALAGLFTFIPIAGILILVRLIAELRSKE